MLEIIASNPIYYFILLIINMFISTWIFTERLANAAGVTAKELRERSMNGVGNTRDAQRSIYHWMESNAPDKKRYRQVRNFFLISMLPGIIALLLLFINKAQSLKLYVSIIIPIYLILLFIIGICLKISSKNKNADKNRLSDDAYDTDLENQDKKVLEKRNIPFSLFLSGYLQALIYSCLIGIVGLFFLIMGFFAHLTILKAVGIFSLIFYLVRNFKGTKKYLSEIAAQISQIEYNEIIDKVLHSGKYKFFSYYDKVTNEIEKKIGVEKTEDELWDEAVESEKLSKQEVSEPQGISAIKELQKRKRINIRSILAKIVGIALLIASIYFIVQQISVFVVQINQKNWPVTTAIVDSVEERINPYTSTNSEATVYYIFYDYYVGEDGYYGISIVPKQNKVPGDTFEIKYDPEFPQITTEIMEPQIAKLIINIILLFVIAYAGLRISGIIKYSLHLKK